MTFKAGQKVIAVESAARYYEPKDSITEGEVYTVSRTEDGGADVYLEGKTQYFNASRFAAYVEPVPVLDFTKPLETQDGRPVKLITVEGRGRYPVLAYIDNSDAVSGFTPDGKYYGDDSEDDRDLRNVAPKPVEREVYVNFVKVGSQPMAVSGTYPNRAEADSQASVHRVGCMKIKLVHGQFDD